MVKIPAQETREQRRREETRGDDGRRVERRAAYPSTEGVHANTTDGKQEIIASVNRIPATRIITDTCWLSSSHTPDRSSLLSRSAGPVCLV